MWKRHHNSKWTEDQEERAAMIPRNCAWPWQGRLKTKRPLSKECKTDFEHLRQMERELQWRQRLPKGDGGIALLGPCWAAVLTGSDFRKPWKARVKCPVQQLVMGWEAWGGESPSTTAYSGGRVVRWTSVPHGWAMGEDLNVELGYEIWTAVYGKEYQQWSCLCLICAE